MNWISKIVMAVVLAVVAYVICILVGSVLVALNVSIAVVVGGLLKEFAGLVSVLVFLWYCFVGTAPRLNI